MAKLDFNYDNELGEEIAFHNGYRIRAARDADASNPFDDGGSHWPFIVRSSDGIKLGSYRRGESGRYVEGDNYEHPEGVKGASISRPLERFDDHALIHNQIHIAKAFGTTIEQLMKDHADVFPETAVPCKYTRDAGGLRDAFSEQIDQLNDSDRFEVWAELLRMVGCTVWTGQVTGHSQGDWAELIVVATPEAIAHYGCCTPVEELPKALEAQADVYAAWAYGDCYGYIIEAPSEVDEDGDVIEWEEIADGSCWGYYGDDHDDSGLADAALESVPSEPAAAPREAACVDA